jgi:hypothetical protein
MSDHAWVQDNLDAYVAGGLPAQDLGRVAQHVADCADCKQALAQAQQLETTMAELFADARPDAKLEERMIRGLRKVSVPMRWPAWTRFAIGAAAVVMLGVVGAIVQTVVVGGAFPGIGSEQSALPNSTNNLKRLATTFYTRGDALIVRAPSRVHTSVMDPASTNLDIDIKYKNEGIADGSVPGLQNREGKRVYPSGDLFLDNLDDSKSMGGEKKDIPVNNHSFAFTKPQAGQIAGYGKDASSNEIAGRSGATHAWSLRSGGGAGETAQDKAVKGLDMISGLTSAGTLTPDVGNAGGASTGVTILNMKVVEQGKRQISESYFNPSDGPALAPPPPAKPSGGAGPPPDPKESREVKEEVTNKAEPLPAITQPKQDPPGPADNSLKIIRTGEMEFEVDSFDNAVKTIMTLIKPLQTKGAFKLKEDSNKQANGKTRGHVVVRMKPEHLDEFVLDLRRELGKVGDLKLQQIGSQDVTKQFTDTESELKAARAVEKRLLAIIENGKGDVKDLVAAEKELGLWRTKIEKMEGEIRYYSNQVALSTLTINLVEKEIAAAAALVVNATVKMRIEVDNVSRARETAEKAVEEFKGRIVKSDEKQHPAGQVEAILHAEIPPANKDAFRRVLEKLGLVSGHEDTQSQTTEGGAAPVLTPRRRVNDVLFQVTLNNIVNIKPKLSVKLEVVSPDVRSNFEKLKDEIVRVHKGQIRDARLDESQDKQKTIASIDFSVPTEKKADLDKLIASFGPTLDRVNTQAAITEISTEQKFGYQLTLYSIATVEPREKVRLNVEVKDVERKSAEIADLVKEAKGQVNKPKSGLNKAGQTEALLVINVPLALSDRLVRDIKEKGKVIDWVQAPNPSVPENDLATAQIVVLLTGPNPIIPSDEGLSNYASKSMYVSFTVFAYCVLFIVTGISFILPWAVVIFVGVWLMRRIWRKPVTVKAVAATEPQKPANA